MKSMLKNDYLNKLHSVELKDSSEGTLFRKEIISIVEKKLILFRFVNICKLGLLSSLIEKTRQNG